MQLKNETHQTSLQMKWFLYAQVILLAATVTIGSLLSKDLSDELRSLHRLFAVLLAVGSLATLVSAFKMRQPQTLKILASLTLILVAIAGSAGSLIGSGVDYNTAMNTMRLSGVLALVLAVGTTVWVHRFKP